MPSRRSGPKAGESWPSATSLLHCSWLNIIASLGWGWCKLSRVSGASSGMDACGQKPSCRSWKTNWMKSWLGCEVSKDLNQSMLMGVTILKRCWFCLIVRFTNFLFYFWRWDRGTRGNGHTVKLLHTDSVSELSLSDQRNLQAQWGCSGSLQHALSILCCSTLRLVLLLFIPPIIAELLGVLPFAPVVTNMLVWAWQDALSSLVMQADQCPSIDKGAVWLLVWTSSVTVVIAPSSRGVEVLSV